MFPFDHIEEDRILFISAISDRDYGGFLLNLTSDDFYLPFEATEENCNLPIFEHNPDNYYYNDLNITMIDKYKYYTQDKFNKNLQNYLISSAAQPLSLCHFDIRSTVCNVGVLNNILILRIIDSQQLVSPKPGLKTIILTYIHCMDIACIMWLKNTVSKRGGGIAVCIKQGIYFAQRQDLSVFSEIFTTGLFICKISPENVRRTLRRYTKCPKSLGHTISKVL